jgi:hypothetical protein
MENKQTLAEFARRGHGLTVKELGLKLCLTRSALNKRWQSEKGRDRIRADMLLIQSKSD